MKRLSLFSLLLLVMLLVSPVFAQPGGGPPGGGPPGGGPPGGGDPCSGANPPPCCTNNVAPIEGEIILVIGALAIGLYFKKARTSVLARSKIIDTVNKGINNHKSIGI